MNIEIKNAMLNHYMKNSAASHYIIGFNMNHTIYMVNATDEDLKDITTVEKAGHNDGYALKFKPNKDIKTYLLAKSATALCSELYFEQTVQASKYNRGEIFEKMVTEYNGQEWTKDNINYRVQGDIRVNDIEIQIKYEKATFITEGQIQREREKDL